MNTANLYWLARRYLAARGWRAWLTAAAVVLGVAMIYATSAAIPAMENAFNVYMASPDADTEITDMMLKTMQANNAAYGFIFSLFGVIALFVGAYLIGITFAAVVTERRRDLAVLRAIGADRRQVITLIVLEAGLQGVVGSLIGLVVGQGIAMLLARFLWDSYLRGRDMPGLLPFSAGGMLLATLIGSVVALAAGYLPARAAARLDPVEAMRPQAVEAARAGRWRMAAAAAALLAGVALLVLDETPFVGLGGVFIIIAVIVAAPLFVRQAVDLTAHLLYRTHPRLADLVRASAMRQPGRTAATLSILTIGFALFAGVGTMLAPISASNREVAGANFRGSAYQLMPFPAMDGTGDMGRLDDADLAAVRALPAVRETAVMRVAQTTIEGVEASIRGLDPAQGTTMRALYLREGPNADLSFSAQQDANDALVRSLAGGMTAIISEGLARATGIGIGDTLTLTVEAGSWPLSVIAVASDYFPATGDRGILVDQDVLALLFPDAPISEVYIGITDEQYRDQLFAELTALFSARSISIWDQLATRDMSIASGERGLSIFYILAAVVMIPSVLGLLNTLVINVLERTHEIGLLRASGADRGHVRRMITAEALLLGAVSAVIGLACGVVLGYGVLETFTALSQGNGEMFTFSLPVTALALMLVVGMAIVWAAAWLPARRAARLDVLTALRAD